MNHGLWTSVMDNVVFVAVSVLIAAALFLIAYAQRRPFTNGMGSQKGS